MKTIMRCLAGFGGGAIALTSLWGAGEAIATSSSVSHQPTLIAQNLVGQCRLTKRNIFIYTERSTSSNQLRALATNERVTLADNGLSGWIAINAPANGFVQASDLKPCTTAVTPAPTPTPVPSLCRQVRFDMNVRATPSTTGQVLRSVLAGQQVTLRNTTERVVQGRSWAEITAPVPGWISVGVNGNQNITTCSRR